MLVKVRLKTKIKCKTKDIYTDVLFLYPQKRNVLQPNHKCWFLQHVLFTERKEIVFFGKP